MKPARGRRLIAGAGPALAAAMLALSPGCATQPRRAPAPTPQAGTPRNAVPPALADLAKSAEAQRRRPVPEARLLAPPPGLGPEVLASLAPAGGEKDTMALAAALAVFRPSDVPPVPERAPPDEDRSAEATRRYIAARQRLMEGDAAGAITDLTETLRLDPGAGEAWRQLAEAQLAAGSRTDAAESLKKAEAAGIRDASLFEMLGRLEAERGRHEVALRWLVRALDADPAQADPLLEPVIESELARSLSALGYHAASRDLLIKMLGRAPAMTASSRYMQEFGAVFRRQGELWREVGDDEMRLGDPGAALAAYEQAMRLPALDGQSAMPRLVYAAMQAGRPAAAGTALLQRVFEAGGKPSPEDLALLGHVARVETSRRQLSAALGQLRATLGAATPTLAADLARAQAAVAPASEARRILAEHLAAHPRDAEAATLMASMAEGPGAATRLAAATISAQPASAPVLAEGLLRSQHDAAAIAEELRTQGGPAPTLLRAWVELKRGYQARADETLAGLSAPAPMTPALALARAEAGLASGRAAHAMAALALLNATDPATLRARARVLAMLQRDAEALDALRTALSGASAEPGERLEDLLLASQLAVVLGMPDDAEAWLRAAVSLDAGDDRALGLLLDFYSPGGQRPDSAKQAQVVRELRQDHAEGRVLRTARATEMVRRSAWAPAEREAARLAAEAPAERAPIELLTAIWGGRARAGNRDAVREGLAWLDRALERRPLEPMLTASKVTLLSISDRSEEAEVILRRALADGGGPDLSRLLERLLRDHLKQPKESSNLALARLESRDRVPAESFELAEVYLRLDRPADGAKAALSAFAPGVTLLPDQKQRLTILAAAAGQGALKLRAAKTPDETAERQSLALVERVVEGGQKLPPEFHEIRLLLMAAAPGVDAADLLKACDLATRQNPQLRDEPTQRVIGVLAQNHRGDVLGRLIQQLLLRPGQDAGDLYRKWYIAIALGGATSDLKQLIESDPKLEQLPKVVQWLREQGQADTEEVTDARAEAAYILGNEYTRRDRQDEANKAFELALEYQPSHGWAANNLGYYLADRGGDLARAEKLLEQASQSLPNEPAVLDSLGWLRYKQNVMEDERDGSGAVTRRGSVSLLQAAAETDHGQQDPTIMNHLGDALWLAGRAPEARRFWTLAQNTASQLVQIRSPIVPRANQPAPADAEARTQEIENSEANAVLAEYKSIASACAEKLSAAAAGTPVRVAPQAGNADPRPRIAKGEPADPASDGAPPRSGPPHQE